MRSETSGIQFLIMNKELKAFSVITVSIITLHVLMIPMYHAKKLKSDHFVYQRFATYRFC